MRRIGTAVAALLLATGCAQEQTAPEPGGYPSRTAPLDDGDRLASWVAGAMLEPEFRVLVLRTMRETPLSEHAVPLNALIDGHDGGRFMDAVAEAGGTSAAEVRALIASLPALDFYVPVREDRLEWRGGSDLVVASMTDRTPPRQAFTPEGGPIELDLAHSRPSAPLFLLQVSEHKAYRLGPQPGMANNRIQEPEEGELAAAYVRRLPDGAEIVVQLRDLPSGPQRAEYCPPDIPGCPPEDEGGGGGGGDPSPPQGGTGSTYLTELQTLGECDNGNCFEGNEFEFHAHSAIGFDVLRIEGVPNTVRWTGLQLKVAPYSPSAQVTITMSAWETDGWPNPDDHYLWVYNDGSLHYGDPILQVTPIGNNGALWPLQKDVHDTDENIRARYGWTQ